MCLAGDTAASKIPIPKYKRRPWEAFVIMIQVRSGKPDLLKELGFAARAFSSAEAFLASEVLSETKCLILDIAMPGMSGPELQNELERLRIQIPIIFITAHGDEAVRSRVLEEGAIKCLPKPFSDTALLQALNAALNGK